MYIGITSLLINSIIISLIISFPIISILYRYKITRRDDSDFSNLIEKRKLKVGTPIMGGLIVVITIVILNLLHSRDVNNSLSGSVKIPLIIFLISAGLGALDDVLNIYGKERKVRRIGRVLMLIKVHKSTFKRVIYALLLPWLLYKRFFYLLGSNPGKGIQAHEKILIQSLCGLILAYWLIWGTGWNMATEVWLPFFKYVDIGIWLMIPFVVLAVLVTTNAVNLTDGMDGLAAGLLISAFGAFGIIAYQQTDATVLMLCVTAVGSLITYLYFNIPPARFQMGDVGSLALGTLLVTIAFALRVPFLLLIIGLPFLLEFASSFIQAIARRFLGRRIFKMAPLHHHLELIGWSEEKVVMRAWIFGILCSIIGLWVYFNMYL
jgi:phospho-N-acetylmuramoyl-pentapeptide-transferase